MQDGRGVEISTGQAPGERGGGGTRAKSRNGVGGISKYKE